MKQIKIKTLKKFIKCIDDQVHLMGESFTHFLQGLRNCGYLDVMEIRIIQGFKYKGCNCPGDMKEFFENELEALKLDL